MSKPPKHSGERRGMAFDEAPIDVARLAFYRAIAFDRASVRTVDPDGHLRVASSLITIANVSDYLGNEIPGYEELGLLPDQIYKLYRDAEELKKGAPSLHGKPLLIIHRPQFASDHDREVVVGSVSNPDWKDPALKAELSVWDGEAIALIESEEQNSLSAGYAYVPIMTPGVAPDGTRFDGRMTKIEFNHVALVVEPRVPGAIVGDSAIPTFTETFQMSKLLSRKAAMSHGALMFYLQPKLAKDAKIDLTPILKDVNTKNFKDRKAAIVKGVTDLTKGKLAKDASIEDVNALLDKLDGFEPAEAVDEEMDDDAAAAVDADPVEGLRAHMKSIGATDEDTEKACAFMKPKAADESPEEKEAREKKEKEAAAAKTAADAEAEANKDKDMKDMVSKKAMDTAVKLASDAAARRAEDATMKRISDIRIAERAVEPLIGKPAVALDSAEKIYAAALKASDVKIEGVDPSAYPALVDMLVKNKGAVRPSQQHLAHDAASVTDRQAFEKEHGIAPRKIRNLG
jgi:hypothetical protein